MSKARIGAGTVAEAAKPDVDEAVPRSDGALTPDEPVGCPRRHLEGFGYYLVYVPALIVSALLALLFVDAVDGYLFGDD